MATKAPAKRKPVKPKFSKNKDSITQLLGSMKSQPKFFKMVDYSVNCLCSMAVDDVSAEEIIESGAIETMLEVIKANPGNEKIQQLLNKLIAKLARNEDLARMIAERMNGNFQPIIESIANATDENALAGGLRAVELLMQAPETISQFADQGLLRVLEDAAKRFPNNKDLMSMIGRIVAKMGKLPGMAVEILEAEGVGKYIMACMSNNMGHLALARAGAAVMCALATSSAAAEERTNPSGVLEKIKKMQGVELLVSALEAHPYDEELLATATQALKALTGASDMELALNVIKGNTSVDAKTASALSTIASLMLVDENRACFMSLEGGVEAVLSIMHAALGSDPTDPNTRRILANAARALARAAADEDSIYTLMKKGAVKALVAVIVNNLDNPEVCEAAIAALNQMLTRPENALYIAKAGGLAATMAAVHKHGDDHDPLLHAGLDMFMGYARDPTSANVLAAVQNSESGGLGSIETLVDIIRHHPNDGVALLSAITTLGALATSRENVGRMVEAGLLPLLVQVLKDHKGNAALCEAAMNMIEVCSLVPENAATLRKLGAAEAIHDVMDANMDNAQIQATGKKALNMLMGQQELIDAQALEAERIRKAEERRRLEEEAERRRLAEEEAERKRLEAAMLASMEQMKLNEEAEQLAALEAMRAEEEEEARRKEARRKAKAKAKEDAAEKERLTIKAREAEKEKAKHAKEEAEKLHLMKLIGVDPKKASAEEVKSKPKLAKSAREVFADDPDQLKKKIDLDPRVKEFLCSGMLLKKHSKNALPKGRHVFLTQDCKKICWKDPKKSLNSGQTISVHQIFSIEKGRCTGPLKRKRLGSYLAKDEECIFAITGSAPRKGNQDRAHEFTGEHTATRTIDLEARNASDCKKWVKSLDHLLEWARQYTWGQETVSMTENMMEGSDSSGEDGEGAEHDD